MFSNIHKIYLINFLHHLVFFTAISVPFFVEWGGLNYTQMLILQSWFMIWVVIFEVPTGMIADKIGRRSSLALSGIFTGIAVLVYASMPNFYVFMLGEFIWAIGISFLSGSDEAIIYDTLKEDKKEKKARYIFSNFNIAGNLGIIIAMPVGSAIAGMMLWPYPNNLVLPMLLTAFPLFLVILVALSLKESKRTRPQKNYFQLAKNGMKYLARQKVLRAFALDMVLITVMTYFMFWLYQPLLGSVGVDIGFYGFVGAGANIAGVILLFNIKRIEKLFSIKKLFFLTAIIPGIMYIFAGLYTTVWTVVLVTLSVMGLAFLRQPLFQDYMNRFIKSSDRATVLSSIYMFEGLAVAAASPIVGMLMDWSLTYTLLILGILTIIFALTTGVEKRLLE